MSASTLPEIRAAALDSANPQNGKRLSVMDRAYILKARALNPPASADAIAETLGCHVRTVWRVLSAAQLDVVPVLASYADDAVADLLTASRVAAAKGYQQPALALLYHGQKLEPILTDKAASGVAVQVTIALSPGTPAFDAPTPLTLDATSVTTHIPHDATHAIAPYHATAPHHGARSVHPDRVIAQDAERHTASAAVDVPSFRPTPAPGESET